MQPSRRRCRTGQSALHRVAPTATQCSPVEDDAVRVSPRCTASLPPQRPLSWALLEEQGITAEQLMAKLEELDNLDGVADGRVRRGPVDCPSCDSRVAPGLTKCQFCGADVIVDEHPLGRL